MSYIDLLEELVYQSIKLGEADCVFEQNERHGKVKDILDVLSRRHIDVHICCLPIVKRGEGI